MHTAACDMLPKTKALRYCCFLVLRHLRGPASLLSPSPEQQQNGNLQTPGKPLTDAARAPLPPAQSTTQRTAVEISWKRPARTLTRHQTTFDPERDGHCKAHTPRPIRLGSCALQLILQVLHGFVDRVDLPEGPSRHAQLTAEPLDHLRNNVHSTEMNTYVYPTFRLHLIM